MTDADLKPALSYLRDSPIELRVVLFSVLSSTIGGELQERGLKEDDIIAEFQSWRKARHGRQP